MDQVEAKIVEVEADIKKVEREIEAVNKNLNKAGISSEDKAYFRKEKDRLGRKEEQLRMEKEQLRTEKLILLQRESLPSIPEAQPMSLEGLKRNFGESFEVVIKRDRATPQKTPSQFGAEEFARLQREGKVHSFEPTNGEESVLSPTQAIDLSTQASEHRVVAFLTPFLESALRCKLPSTTVLVNSEEFKWLKTSDQKSSYNQKPDMFVCHRSIYKSRKPFNSSDEVLTEMRRETDVFGQLLDWNLRRFINIILEAKQRINDEAFAEVINYGAHICVDEYGPVTVRFVLFDKSQFWLVESVKGTATSIEKCNWTDSGSKLRLANFALQDPIMELLDKACADFMLKVGDGSYLGQGAFGVVFRVQDQTGRSLALKVVPDTEKYVVELERQALWTKKAHGECPHLVVGIEEDGYRYYENLGAILLQSEVGEHYARLSPFAIRKSLEELHSNGIVHGDARLDNVVCISGEPKWIDFRTSYFGTSLELQRKLKADDIKSLSDSIASFYPFQG